MSGPRLGFADLLRQMAQKPDASAVSKNPRKTPGMLGALMEMLDAVEQSDARMHSGIEQRAGRSLLSGIVPDVTPRAGLRALGNTPRMDPETLVGVALKHDGQILSKTGFDGGHRALMEANGLTADKTMNVPGAGFITSSGRFVDRAEALEIARKRHGLLNTKHPTLAAEDLSGLALPKTALQKAGDARDADDLFRKLVGGGFKP